MKSTITLYRGIDNYNIDTLNESINTNSKRHTYLNTTNSLKLAKEYGSVILEYDYLLDDSKLEHVNIDDRLANMIDYDNKLRKLNLDGIEINIGGPGVKHYRTKRKLLKLRKVLINGNDPRVQNRLNKLNLDNSLIQKID